MDKDRDAPQLEDELILRVLDGDESALGELLLLYGPRLERALQGRFRELGVDAAEDVVAEAIRRFWAWRANYDPAKAKVSTVLYKIAVRVAAECHACRRNWEKVKASEQELSDAVAETLAVYDREIEEEHAAPEPPGDLGQALSEIVRSLEPLQREIMEAYAGSLGDDLDAGGLGIELGKKHNGGVPIPAGTIRVYKYRTRQRIIAELRRRGFDLEALGYLDE